MIEYEKEIASNCCSSSILVNTDICSACGEHCAPVLLDDLEEEDRRKIHSCDYTNNQYITMKTQLEEGIYTFQVKVEKEGLVLDVFLHVGDEDEHVITKTAWYEDIGLRPTDLMDKLIKRYKPT